MMTELFERSNKVTPGGVHSPVRAFKSVGGTPVFFKKASGAYLEDVDGRRYIDFCQSFGPMILGHRDPDVSRVVHEMVDTAWCLGACEPYSLRLAEWITQAVPWVEKVRFVNSGTEAVMTALRVARAATGKNKILKFDGCYHGHVDSMLVKAGSGLAGESSSDSAGVSASVVEDTLVATLDDEVAFEKIMEREASHLAAVIIEPLPANYGLLVQRAEFLKRVAELCHQHKVLLIFDEVISGFRVAMGGMAELTGIRPDLVTYGKVMGGGFNVAAFGGRRELMDLLAPQGKVYQAGTLSANPIGMAAGLATLEKLSKNSVHKTLAARTKKFSDDLQSRWSKADIPLQITHEASIFWIHGFSNKAIRSLKEISSDQAATYRKFFHAALERGMYLAPSGFEVGFVSLAHTEEILNLSVDILEQSAKAVFLK